MFLEVVYFILVFFYKIVVIFELVWIEVWEFDLRGESSGKDLWGRCFVFG